MRNVYAGEATLIDEILILRLLRMRNAGLENEH